MNPSGSGIFRGRWGIGAPQNGTYAYTINNLMYGSAFSNKITVNPNEIFAISTWVRGKIDAESSGSCWRIRADFYNSSGTYVGYRELPYNCLGTLSE